MKIAERERLLNMLLKELNVDKWEDRDKILLFKALLYESLYDEYYRVNWIKVIERVIKKPWTEIKERFERILGSK